MGYTRRRTGTTSTSGTSNDDLMQMLMSKYGEEAAPKANVLERLLAPLTGIGSGVDAYYDARFEQGDKSFGNIAKNYGTNLLQGFGTLFTGKKYEDEMQGLSSVLDKTTPTWKRSALGGSSWGRMGVDIAAGIVTDPTTFLSFGATSLTDDLVKTGAKAITGMSDDVVKKVTSNVVGKSMDDATRGILTELGPEAADQFSKAIIKSGGKGVTKGATKVFGKTVSEDAKIANTLRGIMNPAGAAAKGAWEGVEIGGKRMPSITSMFPDASFNLEKVFNEPGAFKRAGRSEVGDALLDFTRQEGSVTKVARQEAADVGFKQAFGLIPDAEKSQFGKLAQETITELGTVATPTGVSNEMKDALTKYAKWQEGKTLKHAEVGFKTISPELQTYITQGNIKAYKPEFLEHTLRTEVGSDVMNKILADKSLLKELDETGEVTRKTLQKLLKRENIDILKSYDSGTLGQELLGQGATKERTFETFKAGEAAGLVYDDDWKSIIEKQTIRQNKQIAAKDATEKLIASRDDTGNQLFRQSAEGIYNVPVTVPGAGSGAGQATMFTDKTTAKMADDVFGKFTSTDDFDNLMGPLDKAMSAWKKWVTGKGPNTIRYHARNAIDDTIRMLVDGHDVKHLVGNLNIGSDVIKFSNMVEEIGIDAATKKFSSKSISKLYTELGITPKSGSAVQDLWEHVMKTGTLSDIGQAGAEMGADVTKATKLGKKVDDLFSMGGRLDDREQIERVAHFADSFRKTGSIDQSAEAVRRTLFNYNELSTAEQEVARRVMPFYSFVKKNMQFYMGALADNPEQIGKFKNVMDGMESGSQSLFGEEWDAMPDYMKEGLSIPYKSEGGELKTLGNLGLSIEGLSDLAPKEMMGNINPFLKNLIEISTGKNLYYDQDILDRNSASAYAKLPDAIKKVLSIKEFESITKDGEKYTQSTMRPDVKYALESTPFLSQVTQLGNKLGSDNPLTKLLLPATIYDRNVAQEQTYRERDKEDALYELLKKKGYASSFSRNYIPSGIKESLLKK